MRKNASAEVKMKNKNDSDKPTRTITFEACTPIECGDKMMESLRQGFSDEHEKEHNQTYRISDMSESIEPGISPPVAVRSNEKMEIFSERANLVRKGIKSKKQTFDSKGLMALIRVKAASDEETPKSERYIDTNEEL